MTRTTTASRNEEDTFRILPEVRIPAPRVKMPDVDQRDVMLMAGVATAAALAVLDWPVAIAITGAYALARRR